jgi:N-acetylglutamate synthase-like GNAT family acetyltransferase
MCEHTYYKIHDENGALMASARVNWATGHIYSFSVFERGRGHGSLLLEKILKDYQQSSLTNLQVEPERSQMQFFSGRGFKMGKQKISGECLNLSKKQLKHMEQQ